MPLLLCPFAERFGRHGLEFAPPDFVALDRFTPMTVHGQGDTNEESPMEPEGFTAISRGLSEARAIPPDLAPSTDRPWKGRSRTRPSPLPRRCGFAGTDGAFAEGWIPRVFARRLMVAAATTLRARCHESSRSARVARPGANRWDCGSPPQSPLRAPFGRLLAPLESSGVRRSEHALPVETGLAAERPY